MLNIEQRDLGKAVILYCQGQLANGDETRLLCAALGSFGRDLIVDLTEVESVDSAGLGALIALQAAGVYLKLQNPTSEVREVLFRKRMNSLFEILETDPAESKNRTFYSCPAA